MKRLVSLIMSLVLLMSLAGNVFAESSQQNTGASITMTNAAVGETYKLYKILDTVHAEKGGSLLYSVDETDNPWYMPFSKNASTDSSDAPFKTDGKVENSTTEHYVVYDDGYDTTDAGVVHYIKEGIENFQAESEIAVLSGEEDLYNTGISKTADSSTVVWENLEPGYYFVTSSTGTVISITNTNESKTVNNKGTTPGFDIPDVDSGDSNDITEVPSGKVVKDNQTGTWGKENSAQIGETLEYKIGIYLPEYTDGKHVLNYFIEDTLDDTLTLDEGSISVSPTIPDEYYKIYAAGNKFIVQINMREICKDGSDICPDDQIFTISYTATVNQAATAVNQNNVELKWNLYDINGTDDDYTVDITGEDENKVITTTGKPDSPDGEDKPTDSTQTYSYGFDVTKYFQTEDGSEVDQFTDAYKLDGAEFALYSDEACTKQILVIYDEDNDVYKVDEEQNRDTAAAIKAGYAKIFGLAEGTYYLKETKAPTGYNILKSATEIVIKKLTAEQGEAINPVNGVEETYFVANAHVINKPSTAVLPETGGIGTAAFTVIGILIMGSAGIYISRNKIKKA